MSLREEQCKKVCRILDDVLANRPTERDSLIVATRSAFSALSAQPEIIRCCECKYLQCNMRPDGYLPKGVDEFECRHWCGSCDPMDFCSYAERREVTE